MEFSPSYQDHKRPELGRYTASKNNGHQLPENVKIEAHCFGNVCKLCIVKHCKKRRKKTCEITKVILQQLLINSN
jgi:hypothetical protein